jgi:WD40 repeat protein
VYTSVAFSPDGGTLASASNNGSLRLWSGFLWSDFTELKNQVYSLVGDRFQRTEWALYAPGIAYQDSCPKGSCRQAATSDDGKAALMRFNCLPGKWRINERVI